MQRENTETKETDSKPSEENKNKNVKAQLEQKIKIRKSIVNFKGNLNCYTQDNINESCTRTCMYSTNVISNKNLSKIQPIKISKSIIH